MTTKTLPARLYVEKPDVLEEILADISINDRPRGRTTPSRMRRTHNDGHHDNGPHHEFSIAEKMHREMVLKQYQQEDAQMQRMVKKAIQKRENDRDAKFKKLMNDMDSAQTTLKSVDKTIDLHFESKRNKMRRQFEDWNVNVHGKIQVYLIINFSLILSSSLN